jgi:hypothetical protein
MKSEQMKVKEKGKISVVGKTTDGAVGSERTTQALRHGRLTPS